MMRRRFLALSACIVLAGCGASGGTKGQVEPSASTAAPTLGMVQSVEDVQRAYVEAGGDCAGDLLNRNVVKTAIASGECPGSGTILTTYIDHDDAKDAMDSLFQFSNLIDQGAILGENWAVNPSGGDKAKIDALAESMGGQVLKTTASK